VGVYWYFLEQTPDHYIKLFLFITNNYYATCHPSYPIFHPLFVALSVKYTVSKFNSGESIMVEEKKGESCESSTCQTCGASVVENECSGCHRDPKACVCEKDVTSSVYPM